MNFHQIQVQEFCGGQHIQDLKTQQLLCIIVFVDEQ